MSGDFGARFAARREGLRAEAEVHEEREAIAREDDPSGREIERLVTGWPASLALDAFHGFAGDVVRTIEPHTEADPAALLVQFLVAAGNAIGGRPFFRTEADRQTANLFAVLVGETARGRKGTSWGHVRRICSVADPDWTRDRIYSGLSSGEGLVWSVRDPIEKQEPIKERGRVVEYEAVIADHGVADKRLLVLQTEFASTLRVLGREGSTLSPTIREAWDTGGLQIITKNSPAKSTGAHVSIVGHITRAELSRYFSETEQANGFGNRILWVCVRRSKLLPEGGSLDPAEVERLGARLRVLLEFARGMDEVHRDEAARAIWKEVYPDLSGARPGLLGAVTARAEAQTMRLALLYALLDRRAEIGADHLKAALAAWAYAEDSAKFVFGNRLGDPVADKILAALREAPDGLTGTEVSGLFGRHQRAREIARALDLLTDLELVEAEQQYSGGRPVERWRAVR